MKIPLEYNYYSIRQIVKKQGETISAVDGLTLFQLFEILENKYGEKLRNILFDHASLNLKVSVLINGVSITDIHHTIKNNDKVNILARTTSG